MSAASRVTVVVVTFHSAHCAAKLGQSLSKVPHLIVVDNASGDNTVDEMRKFLPQALIVVNERNLGFGAANNRGWRLASTEFVLLLNPDCLLEADAIQRLVEVADTYPNASMLAPQLRAGNGRLDMNYRWVTNTWEPQCAAPVSGDTCVGFVSGACMLIRRESLASINGFDERFFLYYEDDDLCVRLWAQAGPIILTPSALVTHFSRSSSAGWGRISAEFLRGYHHIQSKFIFEAKHANKLVSPMRRMRYAIVALIEMSIRLIILDWMRAIRVAGRLLGALRFDVNNYLKND